jgi:hypothetical protein
MGLLFVRGIGRLCRLRQSWEAKRARPRKLSEKLRKFHEIQNYYVSYLLTARPFPRRRSSRALTCDESLLDMPQPQLRTSLSSFVSLAADPGPEKQQCKILALQNGWTKLHTFVPRLL